MQLFRQQRAKHIKNLYQILHEGFDLMILLWGLLHEYFVKYCSFIHLSKALSLCNLVDITKLCPHVKKGCKIVQQKVREEKGGVLDRCYFGIFSVSSR